MSMNPFAGLNGFGSNPAAARVVSNNAGLPNGLNVQGSLPMEDNKATWMQNQGLGLGLGQRLQQLPGVGLQGLPQVASGGSAQVGQGGGLPGLGASTGLGGAGIAGQNLQAMQLQQQLQAQQQQAAQQALFQQQLRQQQLQQLQAVQQQQQQQQLAAIRQQQLQQQLQQQQLLQQQQQLASAGLPGNSGLVQNSLQSLMGGANGNQLLLNQGGQLGGNRQADLLGNQMQLQGAAGQVLTTQQQQQLLQQQLLKQAAQQGASASQGLQFGGTGVAQTALLQQHLQQASNAQKLRSLAQLNAAQQDLARRQQQAQLHAQAAQAQQQQVQALHLQQQLRQQQQLQQLQAAQAAVQQQQSANQQAVNAAAIAALRANGSSAAGATPTPEQQQLLRLMAAAAGKADTVGSLPSQLATASATASLAQRQIAAGLAVQQKAAGMQGTAPAGPSAGTGAVAATQAMLQSVLAGNRASFEPANPARVGVIGQERTKQASTDLGASTPLPASTNAALSSLTSAAALGSLNLLVPGTAGPSRQATPPPASGTPTSAAASTLAGALSGNPAVTAADMAGPGLPLTASPEHVEAFLKAVGKRFAAMGLTIEQALEFDILKGLTREQLAVLSESQHTANQPSSPASASAESSAAAAAVQGLDRLGLLIDQALPNTMATAGGSATQPISTSTALVAGADKASADTATTAAQAGAAGGGDDDDDKMLESLLEPEDGPAALAAPAALDEAAAALLGMPHLDANFNAFTYGFFGDTSDTRGGGGDLLGELEPEGATLDGPDTLDPACPAVCDLSELADFEPVDPAQLASWGSMDVGQSTAGDDGALAAVAGAARPAAGGDILGSIPQEGGVELLETSVQPASVAVSQPEALASNLKGLSLGAGFD